MRRIVIAISLFLSLSVCAQTLSTIQQAEFTHKVQSLYYSQRSHGLSLYFCRVRPDWASLPAGLRTADVPLNLDLLSEVSLRMKLTADSDVDFSQIYPDGFPDNQKAAYKNEINTYSQYLQLLIYAVEATTMDGPLAAQEGEWTIEKTTDGYIARLKNPDVTVAIDQNYHVTKFIAQYSESNTRLELTPVYKSTPEGLLLDSSAGLLTIGKNNVPFHFDLTYQTIEGLNVLDSAHLTIPPIVDTDARFTDYTIEKAAAPAKGGVKK